MARQPLRNRSRWSLDFTKSSRAGGSDMPSPPGFSASINALHAEASRQSDPSLRAKRSWDLALGPIKQVSENIPKKSWNRSRSSYRIGERQAAAGWVLFDITLKRNSPKN